MTGSTRNNSNKQNSHKSSITRPTVVHRLAHLLYQPYKILVFVPLLCVFSIVMGGTGIVMATLFSARSGMKLGGIPWGKLITLSALVRVRVKNRDYIVPKQSYVVVANHQSVFDIFTLVGWLNMDLRLVAKASLRRVPVFGIASAKMDHIFIDRSNTQAALRTINDAKKNIVDGTSVLFFPEGTRSVDGNLKAFKNGAFKMALDLGIPILPVTVRGTKEILPSGSMDLFPGKAEIVIHPPIDIESYSPEALRELAHAARTAINTALP